MRDNNELPGGNRSRGMGPGRGRRSPLEGRASPGCGLMTMGFWIVIGVGLFLWLSGLLGQPGEQAARVGYSEFRDQLEAGNVSAVTLGETQLLGDLVSPATTEGPQGELVEYERFQTYLPAMGDDALLPLLRDRGVAIQAEPAQGATWWPLLLNLVPVLLVLGVGWYFVRARQSQGQGLFSMGESRARLYDSARERTTFGDVAGATGAKEELCEIIEFLRNPSQFSRLGAKIPKGVLLVGPPGTGKTLLARAVAGEAGVPFLSISGSDFMEMFVGVGASRVRAMFKQAKKAAPSIIFVDELDSIGRRRGAGVGGGHDEREQTLNQLLSEMDGFEANTGIIMMAATNRPDILDPALLRPGRFDRRIQVDLPTLRDRLDIIKIHTRNKPLATDVDLEKAARGTPGFSGADLENLFNEAALLAARKDGQEITQEDVDEARDKVIMGLERGDLALTDRECELLAYHEAGHALVAAVLPNADPLHKITIVPRGMAMGVTQQLPERDRFIYHWDYMLDRLAVMMGGRASEQLALNTATSGAENDLKQATLLARKMVLDWGVTDRIGPVALGDSSGPVFLGEELGHARAYSETTAREVDEEVRRILTDAHGRATATLRRFREALDRAAQELMANEELTGQQFLEIVGLASERSVAGSEAGIGEGQEGEGQAGAVAGALV